MLKKYLIRVAGALCILGAIAMMLLPTWIQVEDVSRRDMREMREDVEDLFSSEIDAFATRLRYDEDFEDELEDFDLPDTRAKVKSRFREIEELTTNLMDDSISIQEILNLSTAAPGILKDTENMLDSEVSDVFFRCAAQQVVQKARVEYGQESSEYDDFYESAVPSTMEELRITTEDVWDEASEYTFVFVLLTAVMVLIIALGVASAVTHCCNKVRWMKYLYLAVLACLVAGTCVALPMGSDLLAELGAEMPALEEATLQITAAPFVAVALMIVPIVLDIIYERKKETVEVEKDGE